MLPTLLVCLLPHATPATDPNGHCPSALDLSVELPPITVCTVWHHAQRCDMTGHSFFALTLAFFSFLGGQIPNERTEQMPHQVYTSILVLVLSSSYPSIQSYSHTPPFHTRSTQHTFTHI
jgi:hypothetical protein